MLNRWRAFSWRASLNSALWPVLTATVVPFLLWLPLAYRSSAGEAFVESYRLAAVWAAPWICVAAPA
ncbi:MAG: hypothetical protein NTZ05_14910 [Chloroflexi bacterium]|nr:hypothetical protein [Chloroflexota bacterium]